VVGGLMKLFVLAKVAAIALGGGLAAIAGFLAPVLAVVAAVAAVAFVVFSGNPPDPTVAAVEPSGTSLLLEQQFSQLEPGARRVLASRVDASRGQMRGQLLALAKGPVPASGDTP
ncbi:MAG: hypothetical protein ACPG77_16820, partial [Nannocystaceae bacterium]